MKIEKNIMATLKREMDKRGVNYAELSAEINVLRMTLQGYLNGTSHPRADSMENLADKLRISVAELVSGEEHFAPVSNPACRSASSFSAEQTAPTV